MKQVEDTCEWDAWLMNEFLELLPVPAEREMPAGSLERRKAALVQLIGAEVSLPGRAAGRLARLRSLRVWLTTLGLVIAVLVSVCSALAATHVRKRGTRATVETVLAVAGGPAVAALAAAPRVRGRVAIRLSGIGREHAGPVGAAPGHARLMTLRRSRRRWLAALGVAAIFALVGAAAGSSGNSPGRSVEIIVGAVAAQGVRVTDTDLARSVEIMSNRLAQLGDQGSVTRRPGSQQIVIRLDGLSLATARSQAQTISSKGRVEFYDLTPSLLGTGRRTEASRG